MHWCECLKSYDTDVESATVYSVTYPVITLNKSVIVRIVMLYQNIFVHVVYSVRLSRSCTRIFKHNAII